MVAVTFFSGIILVSLWMIGEYIAKYMMNVKIDHNIL